MNYKEWLRQIPSHRVFLEIFLTFLFVGRTFQEHKAQDPPCRPGGIRGLVGTEPQLRDYLHQPHKSQVVMSCNFSELLLPGTGLGCVMLVLVF